MITLSAIGLSHCREEASFSHTQQDPGDEKLVVVLDETLARHHSSPADHHDADPPRGSHQLEHNVAGYLQQSIREEEHSQCEIVLISCKAEVDVHASHFRISYVATI